MSHISLGSNAIAANNLRLTNPVVREEAVGRLGVGPVLADQGQACPDRAVYLLDQLAQALAQARIGKRASANSRSHHDRAAAPMGISSVSGLVPEQITPETGDVARPWPQSRTWVIRSLAKVCSSVSLATSHSAMPRRVQYLRGLGGGNTSHGNDTRSAMWTRSPLRLDVGVCAPE